MSIDITKLADDHVEEAERLLDRYRPGDLWRPAVPPSLEAAALKLLEARSSLAPRTVGGRSYLLPIDPAVEPLYGRVSQGDHAAAARLRDHLRSRDIPFPLALDTFAADPPRGDSPADRYARGREACRLIADPVWVAEIFGRDEVVAARWLERRYFPELRSPGVRLKRLLRLHQAFPDEADWQRLGYRIDRMEKQLGGRRVYRVWTYRGDRVRLRLPLGRLRLDGGTHARAELRADVVAAYAAAASRGDRLPPAKATFDGRYYWVWDGFYTCRAREVLGLPDVECQVTDGTVADARWLALGANQKHGLRRADADVRRAVAAALRARPWQTNLQIAEHCGVDRETVRAARAAQEAAGPGVPAPEGGGEDAGPGPEPPAAGDRPEPAQGGAAPARRKAPPQPPAIVYDPYEPSLFDRPDSPDLRAVPVGDLEDLLVQAVRAFARQRAGNGGRAGAVARDVLRLVGVLSDRYATDASTDGPAVGGAVPQVPV
jgi:hypothetical protein